MADSSELVLSSVGGRFFELVRLLVSETRSEGGG